MAKAIGTSWTTLKTYDWIPGTGFKASFYLEARYSSTEKNNIEGNYSNIYTRLRSAVHAGQGSGSNYNFTCSYAPNVKGSAVWYLGNEVITESGVTKITHEDDGTKIITLTASGSISPIGLNFSISEDVVLDTIPRATTLLDQSGTIGHNITINWTPASDKFTHKLTYSFGSIKDEVLGTNLKKSFTWSIPTKLYKEFTGQSAKGTLKLTTYNGTTQIGSAQEVGLTIYANQSFSEPVIDGASLKDINRTTVALTGDDGTFILGQSKLFLTLTFKTRNFATLKSLSINGTTIANNKVTAGKQSTDGTTVYGLEYEYGTLNTQQLLFRVTDTRNYTVELKSIISDSIVIKYVPLTAVTTFKRITPTGGKVGLVFNGNYFNGSFGASSNTLEISYKYKKSTDSTYTTINLVNNTDYKISGNTYYSGTGSSKQTITLAPIFDYKTQYDVQVVIKDKLTTLPTINAIISKGIPIMWWNGEKVQVNGDLYLANEDGENATPLNVSGNVSKNLYNKNNVYIEGASNQNAGNNILVLPNTTYTFSIGKYTYGEVKEFDNSGVQINDIGGSESSKIITFTTSSNAKYITTLFFTGTYNNVSLNEIDFTQVQLEKGSVATEYEEYYEPKISIRDSNGTLREVPYAIGKASKNLFDKAAMVEFTNGYRLYTNGTFNNNSSFYGLKIPVQPNTTYTSSSNLTDTNLWSDLCFFDKDMNFISGVEGRANKTFTTPTNCYFVTYAIYNQYQWFQLEKGSTATEYEEYYEPTISVKDSNGNFQEIINKVETAPAIVMADGYTLSGAAFGKQPILEKQGKIVHLAMLVVAENGFVDTLTGIARLPEGFRPKYTQVFPCGLANAHLWYMDSVGYLNIGSDGYVNIRNSTGTKKYAFINITYITD